MAKLTELKKRISKEDFEAMKVEKSVIMGKIKEKFEKEKEELLKRIKISD